jgi:hypothetical protein
MQQDGRAAVPDFAPSELLFRRYRSEHFQNGRLVPAAFRFDTGSGQSFNRSLFSQAEHTLHRDCCDGQVLEGWGVWECVVGNLPTPVLSQDGRAFNFFPKHVPRPTCYAHSELWCHCHGSSGGKYERPPANVRETLKILLSRVISIKITATL